ncbi:MAG: type II toxin-antitoxin system VapC family toxin [Acidobacteria bacterium]|nr:type II toxin-antitoxin system VapC family toxin [Acidobacteriota bacterium]
MVAYFFDTSALVKRYVNEQGSTWVAAAIDPATGARVYVAAITGVEVVSAIARKLKGNHVSASDAVIAASRFHYDFANEYRIVSISDAVINRSIILAETHALRGYDAVQLGAALEINGRRMTFGAMPLTLVTSDTELLTAAFAEKLLTDDPNLH